MSNSEDQDTSVQCNEQERDGSEATPPRKINEPSAQGGDGPNIMSFRIITEEEEYKWSLLQDMASYANDNSEKYISEKDVKEAILIKTPRPDNLTQLQNWTITCRSFRDRKKGIAIDIAIDNTLEKAQDKALDIMGLLPKLWVMVEQVNSGSASSSTVEIDTVLKILEKTVLLIGKCNNTITYERRKKVAFLQKHDQAHYGKYLRDLTESLKAKKQSIEAIAEVCKSTNRKRPFREGPSFYQGRPDGWRGGCGKNSGRFTTVNTFCSKKKERHYSNNQISIQVMINMEELTHVHPILKILFSKQRIPKCVPAGRIKEFLSA